MICVDVCFECPNVSVSTNARCLDDVHSAGVPSAGLKRDDYGAKSNKHLDSQEPVNVSNDSNFCIAGLDHPIKSDCLDTCTVEVHSAGVDCPVNSDSLNVYTGSLSSEDYVDSN